MSLMIPSEQCSTHTKELTKKQMLECLAPLSIYDGFKESFTDIYYEVLKKYSYDKLKKAIKVVLETYEYNSFPKPAVIISALESLADDDMIVYNNISYPRRHCFCDKNGTWKPIQKCYDEYILRSGE